MTHHQDSVDHHSQRDYPYELKKLISPFHEWSKPVQDNNESPDECYEEAEVAVTPDPDGEGQEHDPNALWARMLFLSMFEE